MKKKNDLVRRAFQISFYLFVLAVVMSHWIESKGIVLPWNVLCNFHAICPFGAVETAGRLIFSGKFIPKIHESNLWVFLGIALSTAVMGPLFCSYLCPLGSVQEWIGKIGKKIFKKRFNRFIGKRADRILGYTRYGVLALVMIQTTRMLSLIFQKVDPFYALFHFWMGDVYSTALIVLAGVLILSLFFERPWCRWFCPLGGLLGLIQLIAPWKIRRNSTVCNSCTACENTCPMNIPVHKVRRVLDTRCNRCGSCLTVGTKRGALSFAAGISSRFVQNDVSTKENSFGTYPGFSIRKIFQRKSLSPERSKSTTGRLAIKKSVLAGFLALALSSAPIVFAQVTNRFNTSGMHNAGRSKLHIEDIKGSMTLSEVAHGLTLQTEKLIDILELPRDTPESTKLYSLEDMNESLTVKAVRTTLEVYATHSRSVRTSF